MWTRGGCDRAQSSINALIARLFIMGPAGDNTPPAEGRQGDCTARPFACYKAMSGCRHESPPA